MAKKQHLWEKSSLIQEKPSTTSNYADYVKRYFVQIDCQWKSSIILLRNLPALLTEYEPFQACWKIASSKHLSGLAPIHQFTDLKTKQT